MVEFGRKNNQLFFNENQVEILIIIMQHLNNLTQVESEKEKMVAKGLIFRSLILLRPGSIRSNENCLSNFFQNEKRKKPVNYFGFQN